MNKQVAKRFRLWNIEEQALLLKSNSLDNIYKYLQEYLQYNEHISPEDTFVDCAVDGIEVNGEDFLKAFDNGETPKDLQFF